MLKTLEVLGSRVQAIMNSPKFQEMMTPIVAQAERKGLTTEQWEELKSRLFEQAVLFILMRDETVREQLASELYDYYRSAH